MSEKMLVTQALDERDLLVKKISDKISKARFLDTVKRNEDTVYEARMTRDEFNKQAEASYQQIQDLITRYNKIDAAIIASNAETTIKTDYGTFTVAGAISLRNRMKGVGSAGDKADFQGKLYSKMKTDYSTYVTSMNEDNNELQFQAEGMRRDIIGKDTKVKNEKPLEVVDVFVKENTTELVDPLGIEKKITELIEKRDALLTELDTQIKVSNATTFIEIA